MCKVAPSNVGGSGHRIISHRRGDVSPSGNVDRGNASPARVGGFGLERNPERVEALLDAVNGQGEVCRVKVAETILQLLNFQCKCGGLFAELILEALHIRHERSGFIAQGRNESAMDINEIRFGGGGMCLQVRAEAVQLCRNTLRVGSRLRFYLRDGCGEFAHLFDVIIHLLSPSFVEAKQVFQV